MLAEGKLRKCYLHPEDDNKVIKIAKKQRLSSADSNQQEWKHYRLLKKKYKNPDFIIKCHGFIETNEGEGLMFDCIRDYDDGISKTILDILSYGKNNYDEAKVFSTVDDFCRFLIKNNIQFFDLNLSNIVIKIFLDNSYKAFAVDIKGRYANYEFIPISTFIPFFSRKKLKRRSKELMLRMRNLL